MLKSCSFMLQQQKTTFPVRLGRSYLTLFCRILFCSSDGIDVYFGFLTSNTFIIKNSRMLFGMKEQRCWFSFLLFFFSSTWWFRIARAQFYTTDPRLIKLMVGYFWKWAKFKQLLKVSKCFLLCYVGRDAKGCFWQRCVAWLPKEVQFSVSCRWSFSTKMFVNLCLMDSEDCVAKSFDKIDG